MGRLSELVVDIERERAEIQVTGRAVPIVQASDPGEGA